MSPTLDHLIVAASDLDRAVAWVETRLGVTATSGGHHPGIGTRNALISFGDDVYLEVVGIDPDQPEPPRPRWFGLDDIEEPRLVTWCARTDDLQPVMRAAAEAGIDLGERSRGGRRRPDGTVLEWEVTDPWASRSGGVVPFFIDWLGSPHPGGGTGVGCSVVELRAVHPRAGEVRRRLAALGLDLPVSPGELPRLVATLDTPRGRVRLD